MRKKKKIVKSVKTFTLPARATAAIVLLAASTQLLAPVSYAAVAVAVAAAAAAAPEPFIISSLNIVKLREDLLISSFKFHKIKIAAWQP